MGPPRATAKGGPGDEVPRLGMTAARPHRRIRAFAETESQTLRALLQMRELILHGEFRAGERLREIPLSERLGVSRTPLRLVLDRLEQEGLVKARPSGGFVVNEFTIQDFQDAIEVRGVLEGTAARLAAERLESSDELSALVTCLRALDVLVEEPASDMTVFARYFDLNGRFHALVLELAKSPLLSRSVERAMALPFASPNAFLLTQAETKEGRDGLVLSQSQHHAIANAIANREGARAEAVAREHSRLARTNLERALQDDNLWTRVPGASLITLPDVRPSADRIVAAIAHARAQS
jgi:GntR family transcriptional regulator, vanillate catabolism transcriptional regulator